MSRAALALVIVLSLLVACTSGPSTSRAERGSPIQDTTPEPTLNVGGVVVEPGAVIAPTPTPEGPRPLVVVTLLNETNVLKQLDAPALAGVVAEIDRLNADGGVLGREVRLIRYDTNSRASLGQRTMSRLVDNPPDLIIASCDTAFSEPILDIADEAGLLTISPCASDVRYLTGAFGPRNFTMGAPVESQGEVAAASAIDRYGDTALVLRDVTSPEAVAFCDGFERSFRELGGTVVYRDEFNYDTLEPVQDRLVERGRDTAVIAVCSHVPGSGRAAPDIISMVRTLGFQAPIIAGSSLDEPTWFSDVPTLGKMTYVSWSSIHGNDPDERINDVVERVRRASDPLNDPLAAGVSTILGAEAIEAWARAVKAAQSESPDRVASALGSFSNEPFSTGEISFLSGARMDTGRKYRIIDVVAGELSVVALETVAE